jgi:23S rRNA (adenine2503-C2)-methyltransferase
VADVRRSRDGTEKLLVALADGERVEAVVIPEGPRRTVCISTQVGCAVGCVFCASGLGGLVRDLAAGEIVEQVLHARRCIEGEGGLSHVVAMGIGEPLANYAALVDALRVLTAPWGLALSGRRITVSTVGLPGRMRRLADEGLGVNLAVSLHAAADATRRRLVPGGGAVGEVMAAARDFQRRTRRDVTLEYVLVRDVNDSVEDARGLAELAGESPILVNLIPLNPVAGLGWAEPPSARVERFAAELRRRRVRVQVRRRRGADIEAACGQLRRQASGPPRRDA